MEELERDTYKTNSPNKTLHEIVSHSRIEKEKDSSQTQSSREETEEDINNVAQDISEAGTSPKIKGSKKNKAGITGDQLPVRILPKRGLKPTVK